MSHSSNCCQLINQFAILLLLVDLGNRISKVMKDFEKKIMANILTKRQKGHIMYIFSSLMNIYVDALNVDNQGRATEEEVR